MSGVTTADSAARADWIGCELNARTSAVPRMREVDIATPFRLILRKRDLMLACLLQLTRRDAFDCLSQGSKRVWPLLHFASRNERLDQLPISCGWLGPARACDQAARHRIAVKAGPVAQTHAVV